jgi:tripartite-type tricarboxylate transporter receptor subunit TctC
MSWGSKKLAATAMVLISAAVPCSAQGVWPERTVTFVVPFAAGGISDVLARLVAERLQTRLKQNFIVENALGAAGTIAATRVARADPDGYTLFCASVAQMTIAPFTHKISYDPIKDFTPISLFATSPFVISVGETIPAKTLPEFIAYVKSKPGQVSYGSAGAGSLTHMAAALFAKSAGLQMNHVPYKGIAPAFQDLVAGHIAMMSPSPVELKPFLEKGTLKALALTDSKRTKVLPNVPAITDFMKTEPVVTWNGLVAPAKTPAAVIDLLSREIRAAQQDPVFLERLALIGVDPVLHTPQDYAKLIADDTERWRTIIQDLGLKVAQ